jgi:hypothetical protein
MNIYETIGTLATVRATMARYIQNKKQVPPALGLAESYLKLSIEALNQLPETEEYTPFEEEPSKALALKK